MIPPTDTVALLAAVWLLAQGRRLHGWWVAGFVLLVLVGASMALPDQRGLRARHFANTEFQDLAESTRVDRRLDFTPEVAELPLEWINNLDRFNFQGPSEPNRELLPFSVEWDGYWWVDTNGEVLGLYMDAPGANGEIVLDGVKVLAMGPTEMTAAASVEPLRGWHQLIVRLSAPSTATRRFSTGQLVDNQRFPFDRTSLGQRKIAPATRTALRVLDIGKSAWSFGVLAWLGVLVALALRDLRRDSQTAASSAAMRHVAVKLFALVAMAEAWWFAWPWAGRVMILAGGDDTLTYESYARHILTDGILMPHLNEPFFYQVLYPYFLAGLHAVFGERMFGPMLVQRLAVGVVAWAIMYIAVKISREEA